MGTFLGYRCSRCGVEYSPDAVTYTCPDDGGNLDVLLDYKRIGEEIEPSDLMTPTEGSIWRYLPLLPVDDPGHLETPLRAVGWTPFFAPSRLAEDLGLSNLWLKDDGRNPTASLKDRASAVVVARAQAIGAEVVVTASTGNAGAALAGMAAAVGMPAVILAPRTAPQAKVAQLLIFGARVCLIDGSYDEAFDLTLEAVEAFGWYCRNTGYNPFTAEGKKTAALEICEQLGWEAPDRIFVSVGDGCIIGGLWKGLKDLLALGFIEKMPKLMGVQAEGAAPLVRAWREGTEEIEPFVPGHRTGPHRTEPSGTVYGTVPAGPTSGPRDDTARGTCPGR